MDNSILNHRIRARDFYTVDSVRAVSADSYIDVLPRAAGKAPRTERCGCSKCVEEDVLLQGRRVQSLALQSSVVRDENRDSRGVGEGGQYVGLAEGCRECSAVCLCERGWEIAEKGEETVLLLVIYSQ